MASFSEVWKKTKGFEGGYQAMPKDSANYCPAKGKPGSQLIGTKFGISAIGMAQYKKKCPTVAEMKNLTEPEAMKVAKSQYWDQIKGDKIKSQALAHLIFDITYGGSSGPLQVRQSINTLAGKNTVKEFKSFTLSDDDINWINKLDEKKLFAEIYEKRLAFYSGSTYQEGLTNRLNSLKKLYFETLDVSAKFAKHNIGKILLITGIIGIALYLILKPKKA